MTPGHRALALIAVTFLLGCKHSRLSSLDRETITACSLAKVTRAFPGLGRITRFEINKNTLNTYRVDIAFTDAKDHAQSMRLLATQYRERPAGVSSWGVAVSE